MSPTLYSPCSVVFAELEYGEALNPGREAVLPSNWKFEARHEGNEIVLK